MTDTSDAGMEFHIRTSFLLLVGKIVFVQMSFGLTYFLSLFLLDIENAGITTPRLFLFCMFSIVAIILYAFGVSSLVL